MWDDRIRESDDRECHYEYFYKENESRSYFSRAIYFLYIRQKRSSNTLFWFFHMTNNNKRNQNEKKIESEREEELDSIAK